MQLTKNGTVITLTDKAHIDAYLSSGWKPLENVAKPQVIVDKK